MTPTVPNQYTALLVLIPTVAAGNMMRTWQQRAADSASRLRQAEAEHEAATQRAIALERGRMASELHDVVTHNVSVMVVQAGAVRRVLDSSPAGAKEALLAIEACRGAGRKVIGRSAHRPAQLGIADERRPGEDGGVRTEVFEGV